jgi:hydroxyethylthiazole kinase-like uncharacterized protein yjeF
MGGLRTAAGTEVLTAAGMRAIEAAAIASGAVTGSALMERAGQGVVEAVFETWPELARGAHRAVVLCGPGNNGGDGFVVARLLRERGWRVEVFLYGEAGRLPPDARAAHDRWAEAGEVRPLEDRSFAGTESDWAGVALVVDALFGIGLARPLDGLATLLRATEDCVVRRRPPARVVAIDVPSGIGADDGRALPVAGRAPPHCVTADLTVTFHRLKRAHVEGDGPRAAGRVVVKDIGLAPWDAAGGDGPRRGGGHGV